MARLQEVADVEQLATSPDGRAAQLAASAAVISYVPRFDPGLLARAHSLKVIACHVCPDDVREQARELGIAVRTSRSLWDTVADHTVSLMLAAARAVPQAHAAVRNGRWGREDLKIRYSGRNVFGKTLGIIGLGRIGTAVARRMSGFEMRVLYHDVERRHDAEESLGVAFRPLDRLLGESDYVVVLVPLNPMTEGLLGGAELSLMKPTAILVNTARGAVIDEEALQVALRDRTIAGAGLDVVTTEPPDSGHPFLDLDNVVLTPHLGGSTVECDMELVEDVIDVLAEG
jgi:phosphoglycerate dehydrogenase-like enzyme